MNAFRNGRLAAREVWLICQSRPIRTEKELSDLEAMIHDADAAIRAHHDASAEARGEELERIAS